MNRQTAIGLSLLMGLGYLGADAAVVTAPAADKYYRIKHASGLYLTDSGFRSKVGEKVEDNTQIYRFAPVDGQEGVYNLVRVKNKIFAGSDGKWTSCPISRNIPLSQYKIVENGEFVKLQNMGMSAAKSFMGTDDYTKDPNVYTDKDGNDESRHLWVIEEAEKYADADEEKEDVYKDTPLPAGDPRADAYDGYRLVFAEEFGGSGKPDPEIWNFEEGFKRNHENQYYNGDKNCYIQDGVLVIEARNVENEKIKNPHYDRYNTSWPSNIGRYLTWTSGSMQTQGGWDSGYTWKYGIYEVRAKVPQVVGCWPAIWSTGKQFEWPYGGEIDILEYYGKGIHGNVAWGNTKRWNATWNSAFVGDAVLGDGWGDEYHIWRMYWDEAHIELWCDDILVNNVDLDTTVNGIPDGDFDHSNGQNPYRTARQMLWLNLALGGDNGGPLADTPRPSRFLVDYARVYQKIGTDGKATYHVDDAVAEPSFNIPDGTGNPAISSGVSNVRSESLNKVTGVYNLQGIRVADSTEKLPKGVYIVKGTAKSLKISL